MEPAKAAVRDFWEEASCGEALYLGGHSRQYFIEQSRVRYELEPYILDFAEFDFYRDTVVLEIGVGLGADHQRFAEAGAILYGIDLTDRSVTHTYERFKILRLKSMLQVADAENLPFTSESFDLVYSWGALHHTPDTRKAINEVFRVLRPGGTMKVMIYHKYSLVGYMLWVRYAFLKFRPMTSLQEIYSKYLESPGTKAYSIAEAEKLFGMFRNVKIKTCLSHADLLASSAGQRHEGWMLFLARLIWPRWFIRKLFYKHGLVMTITGNK